MGRSEDAVQEDAVQEDAVRDDAELVVAARSDAPEVFGELVARWFDRCWEVAWRILRDRELAADVAQETLLRAWEDLATLQQPASFGGWVLRIARNRALDRQRRERWTVPTADDAALEPAARERPVDEDPARRAEQRQAAELVWSAATVLGERDLSLLDLHLRHGLEPHELADELGLAPNAAHQALFRLRKRLGGAVRARLMWHDGEPACVSLRAELAAAGSEGFDATTVRLIDRHVPDCLSCSEEHTRVADPVALFAAVPFVAAPVVLRAEAVRWLGGAGVPVDPAYAATGGAPDGSHDHGGEDGAGHDDADPGAGAAAGAPSGWRRRVSVVAGGVAVLLVVGVLAAGELHDGLEPPRDAVAAGSLDRTPPPTDRTARRDLPFEEDAAASEEVDPPAPSPTAEAPVDPPPSPEQRASTSPRPEERPRDTDPEEPRQPEPTEEPSEEPSEEPTDTPTTPPPPEPVIEHFVVRAGATCPNGGGHAHTLAWETSEADTVTLSVGDGPADEVATTGTVQRCAPLGSVFELTATGPGGSVQRTETAN